MALKATIFKAELQITDLDRDYYQSHPLTLARHPSETDERMMVRLVAFILHAHENLDFTKGLSTDDEPDLWQKSLSGEIDLWIEVGLPDERRIRKACSRARQVIVYSYGERTAPVWWKNLQRNLSRFDNLTVAYLPRDTTEQLASRVERAMQLQCTVQDGELWISDSAGQLTVVPEYWQQPKPQP